MSFINIWNIRELKDKYIQIWVVQNKNKLCMTFMNISNIRVLKDKYIQRVLQNKNKLCMTFMNISNIRVLKDNYIQIWILQNKSMVCMSLMNISNIYSAQGKLHPKDLEKFLKSICLTRTCKKTSHTTYTLNLYYISYKGI